MRNVRQISQAFLKALEQSKDPLLTLDLSFFPKPKFLAIPHPYGQIFHTLKHKTVEILNKNHSFLTQSGQNKTPIYLSRSDLELLEAYIQSSIAQQYKVLEKHLFILPTIVTLAPFVGLLGTAWGILITFSGLHTEGTVSSNSAVLGGLSTALATTVLGLVIAIPALIAYNYLKSSLREYSLDMNSFLGNILATIEMQYRKVE
jgi:biopolymer transport protein TolQ